MKKILSPLIAALCCAVVTASDLIPGVRVEDKGVLEAAGIRLSVMHFTSDWRNTDQRWLAHVNQGFPVVSDGNYRTNLRFQTRDGIEATLDETLKRIAPDALEASYRFTAPAPSKTARLGLNLTIPCDVFAGRSFSVDDEKIALAKKYAPDSNRFWKSAKTLSIPRPGGMLTLSGEFAILFQDDRQYGADNFSISLFFAPGQGEINDAQLKFQLRNADIPSTPLALQGARTVPFAKIEGLQSFPVKRTVAGGVSFAQPGAIRPDGKCVLPAGGEMPFLYLLHAFGDEGKEAAVTVRYQDGTETEFQLVNGVHGAGLTSLSPIEGDGGALVWTGGKQAVPGGLYLTRLDLKPDQKVSSIELAAKNWIVAGISSSSEAIELPDQQPLLIVPNAEWRPVSNDRSTVKGSILDFSGMLDAPAGKYGPLEVRNGRFVFAGAPVKPVRFYGANLCFSANFMEKKYSDQAAEQMAMLGYNTARIHHYDAEVCDRTGKNLAPDRLDRLDYLFSALKKRGLYVSIDLFTIRRIDPKAIPEVAGKLNEIGMTDYKMLLPVSDAAFADWQNFARSLLTHRNPHTGMTWAEDPALISICTVNEDGPMHYDQNPVIRNLYLAKFETWKAENPKSAAAFEGEALFRHFLADTWRAYFAKQHQFLKSLGSKALLTDLNWYATPYLSAIRDGFDFIDNHQYHDHPSFPVREWNMPFGFKNTNPVQEFASTPRELMPTRLFGKPFTVTEFNYCFPNPYRNGGTLLFAAYAALQDWDGLYRFAWSHEADAVMRTKEIGPFDIANDPGAQLAERLGVLLFLRRDAAPAKEGTAYILDSAPEKWTAQVYPKEFTRLGLRQRIGTVVAPKPLPAGVKPFTGNSQADAKAVTGDTGEITLNAETGDFSVVTPKTEGFMLSSGQPLNGKRLKVTPDKNFQVAAATVRDRAPSLAQSKRILIIHLSESMNSRARFTSPDRKLLEALGSAPLLFRSAAADFELDLPALKKPKLYRLDHTGKRLGELPFTNEAGKIRFRNQAAETPVLELVEEN